MDTNLILNYLSELSKNNNREWYHSHKNEYKEANAQFEAFLQELILRIGEFDKSILHNEPKKLTFKLVRDTRFSHDKSPYNPSFRAHIASQGKLPIPVGYYIMIKPDGKSFLGGGLFADMFRDATSMVRDYISVHPEELKNIIEAPEFKEFFTVGGTALKNVPKGYSEDNPMAEFLKFKSWYIEYPIKDTDLCDAEKLLALSADIFRRMKPFNDYLNLALKDFTMPSR